MNVDIVQRIYNSCLVTACVPLRKVKVEDRSFKVFQENMVVEGRSITLAAANKIEQLCQRLSKSPPLQPIEHESHARPIETS